MGVVLDLMIHDIDLVLSLVRSPVRKVEALGISVLGGHEDVANARLEFECGCVATLSASRVSYEAVRRMQVWSPRAFAAHRLRRADRRRWSARAKRCCGGSSTSTRCRPTSVEHYQQHFAEEHLPRETQEFDAVDALALELHDFVDSIRTGRQPRVTGEAGRDAVAVAEQILARIHTHAWDDQADGPVGPLAVPRPRVIPAPHFTLTPGALPLVRRDAG